MQEVEISTGGSGERRHVTVAFKQGGFEQVTARFFDQEQPDETNAQERLRLIARARGMLAMALGAAAANGEAGASTVRPPMPDAAPRIAEAGRLAAKPAAKREPARS